VKKPRSDSVLKLRAKQSPEFGEKVYAWAMEAKSGDCPGGLAHAKAQLEADGISVALSTVSEFCKWWELHLSFSTADARTRDFEELLQRDFPEVTPEKIAQTGQLYFTMLASNSGDSETFKELEYLRVAKLSAETKAAIEREKLAQKDRQLVQKDEELKIARAKFQRETCELFIAWVQDEEAKRIATSGSSRAEQIELLGRKMFGEGWNA
jgi:hypothetical protein